jgi:hypothetical protein
MSKKRAELNHLMVWSGIVLKLKKDCEFGSMVEDLRSQLNLKNSILLYNILNYLLDDFFEYGEAYLKHSFKETARKKGNERRKVCKRLIRNFATNFFYS